MYEDFPVFTELSGWSDWVDSRRPAFLLTEVGAEARRLYRTGASVNKLEGAKPRVSDPGPGGARAEIVAYQFHATGIVFKMLFILITTLLSRFGTNAEGPDELSVIYSATSVRQWPGAVTISRLMRCCAIRRDVVQTIFMTS